MKDVKLFSIYFYKQENNSTISIAVFGKIGKTGFIYIFITNKLLQEYGPTIEDSFITPINIDGKNYELKILDTPVEEDYQSMIDEYIKFEEGFILFFDVTNKESFEFIKKKYERIIMHNSKEEVPIVLVGNINNLNDERQVSF